MTIIFTISNLRLNPEKKVKKKVVKSVIEDQDFCPAKQAEAERVSAKTPQRLWQGRAVGGTSGQVRVRRNVGVYTCGECGKNASTPNGLRVHRSQNNHYADMHIGMKTNLLKTETENLLCNFRAENAKYRLQFASFEGTRCELL